MFNTEEIPTLDSTLWLEHGEKGPRLLYRFFSKPMSSPYTVLETSAWAWNSKAGSLTQEVFRRLQNTSPFLPTTDKLATLESFCDKLRHSSYNLRQVRQIICAGIQILKPKSVRDWSTDL